MTFKPTGIFHITGESDTGKTLAALGAYHPKQTAYFFDDVKQPPVSDKDFGVFVNLVDKYSNLKMLEFYKAVKNEIDNLPEIDAIIFDTWARFGKSIRYYAKANPLEFREASTFSKNGTIKNMEQWSETNRVEADVISLLAQKCKALFLITHIKPQIIAGAKTGSFEPDCGKSFDKVCNMRIWLRHNPQSGVPISLVLKRLSKVIVDENGITPVNVLPRKITPDKEHHSIWDSIDYYWQNPVGSREPTEDEIPTPFELSILDGVLTDSQKEMWQAEVKENQRQEKEMQELASLEWNEVKEFVKSIMPQDTPAPMAAAQVLLQVQNKYPDYGLEDIAKMIGE